MSAGYGTPIKAIGDGKIVANGTNSGWGNWVAIQHTNNMVSVYGHMSSLSFLKVGTQVTTGTVIGYEGNTGNATGSHLHLSLYREFFTYLKGNDLYFNYFEGSLNPADYL
jgi:murein DD-endopeptidase MepM/ murein hydrolase activator NlpD